MGKKKHAKKEQMNIDAETVKTLFVDLATPKGIILTSTTPQLKDLGDANYHYTMRGLDKTGMPCVVVLNSKRNKVSTAMPPVMRSVDATIVAKVNAEFATGKITALCNEENLAVAGEARPVEIPIGTAGIHYGYAMCAHQGTRHGFAVIENGIDGVRFVNETPKFI